jgi:hypothetical protein
MQQEKGRYLWAQDVMHLVAVVKIEECRVVVYGVSLSDYLERGGVKPRWIRIQGVIKPLWIEMRFWPYLT